jgi:hypothetical protein
MNGFDTIALAELRRAAVLDDFRKLRAVPPHLSRHRSGRLRSLRSWLSPARHS